MKALGIVSNATLGKVLGYSHGGLVINRASYRYIDYYKKFAGSAAPF